MVKRVFWIVLLISKLIFVLFFRANALLDTAYVSSTSRNNKGMPESKHSFILIGVTGFERALENARKYL